MPRVFLQAQARTSNLHVQYNTICMEYIEGTKGYILTVWGNGVGRTRSSLVLDVLDDCFPL